MKVAFHAGEREVKVGDRFRLMLEPDGEWEVAKPPFSTTYGPSGLGGTPVFPCRLVSGGMPEHWRVYQDADGLIDICGDSIAAAMEWNERLAEVTEATEVPETVTETQAATGTADTPSATP